MSNWKIIASVALAALLGAGAIGVHRLNRSRELASQRNQKLGGLVTVSLATVETRAFRSSIPFTGTLLAVNRAELKAEQPGRVTRVAVNEGDKVAAGSLLSTQDEDELGLSVQAAEAQLAQARVQADQAARETIAPRLSWPSAA